MSCAGISRANQLEAASCRLSPDLIDDVVSVPYMMDCLETATPAGHSSCTHESKTRDDSLDPVSQRARVNMVVS